MNSQELHKLGRTLSYYAEELAPTVEPFLLSFKNVVDAVLSAGDKSHLIDATPKNVAEVSHE